MIKRVVLHFLISCCIAELNAQAPLQLKTVEVARGLTAPVGLAAPADGTGRLFVLEQSGKIRIVANGKVLPQPFLNLSSLIGRVSSGYSEKGLLGMAFHPSYRDNGRFYVYYSVPHDEQGFDHKSVVAEFRVSSQADQAGAQPSKIILEVPQPEGNHNGGQLAFGPDGFLYIGLGDGGGAGDRHGLTGNSQNMNSLLGKILRIDIDRGDTYLVPSDNPFVNKEGIRPEIWASGLRNPWRFSFDRGTGRLLCGDVGQNKWEEIDLIQKGRNYGWRIMEGSHCYNPADNCRREGLTLPVAEYDHAEGVCVIGGYVYRGMDFPSLHGYYLFGDWTGKLWYLRPDERGVWNRGPVFLPDGTNEMNTSINSFGEDERGNVYVLTQKEMGPASTTGIIYKLSY